MQKNTLFSSAHGTFSSSWVTNQTSVHLRKLKLYQIFIWPQHYDTAAAAKSLQSCPTLCSPISGSPPGSSVPGILQARTLEWVAISFSNAWKWKLKVKSLNCVQLLGTPWTAAYQAPPSKGFPRQEYYHTSEVRWRRQWHPLQYSCLENPMDGGAWWAVVHGVAEWLHFQFSLSCIGEGNSNPLQCSCLEHPRDRGAWWAAVYGVAQSRTRLKRLSSSSSSSLYSETSK